MEEHLGATVSTSLNIDRDEIVNEITSLATTISLITGYSTKNLLIEVSKITRDQLANESIRPDFGYFRVQIFKYLLKYADLAEQKSRILSPLFIDLYRSEYCLSHDPNFQNILRTQESNLIKQANNQILSHENYYKVQLSKSKDVANALKALLLVFSQFHSPKTVFREAELREIYYELLLCTDSELQDGALSCLLTYKEPFIFPYGQNLHNLLNEKKLNDELVLFTVDEQNCAIDEKHRENLMPYVMRILYGRFNAKSTIRGKTKRTAIFRFLASCKSDELNMFIKFAFDFFIRSFDVFTENLSINKILNSLEKYDPTNTFPLYKIRSTLGILNDMFIHLSCLLNAKQVKLLFAVNLVCALHVNKGLEFLNDVSLPIANLLKSLRMLSFQTFIQFFGSFQFESMEADELICLFTAILEPMICNYNNSLSKEKNEIIIQVSVAKLFMFWSQTPRYFSLLNYSFSKSLNEESPISLLCNMLLNPGTPKSLQNSICGAILNLLKEEHEAIDNNLSKHLPQKPILKDENVKGFGTRILLTQTTKILHFLSMKIPETANEKSKIPYTYLEVLNRISLFANDEKMGEKFALTFLSYLGNNRLMKKREKMVELFNTLSLLSKHISDPISSLRRVIRFLSKLSDRSTRDALINFILALKNNANFPSDFVRHLDVLAELEAYDKSRIDEPDLERRFSAFELIEKLYERDNATPIAFEIIQLFAHSHAFNIMSSSNIALRKTSSNALRRLIRYIAHHFYAKNADYILCGHIIPLVLDGLNSSNEICRMEFVYCLADLIARFPNNVHFEKLQCLNKFWRLEDNDQIIEESEIAEHYADQMDNELNFFENAIHIQIHRRQRAFYRLTEQLKSGEMKISSDLMLRFISPLFKPYLLEVNSQMSALSDQSIRLFGIILEKSSWRKYYQHLESYMRQIDEPEKTKGVVRVLIAILGAFHFDVKELPNAIQPVISSIKRDTSDSQELSVNGNTELQSLKQVDSKETVIACGMEEEESEDNIEDEEGEKSETHTEPDTLQIDDDMDMEEEHGEDSNDKQDFERRQKILDYMVNKVLPRLRQALQSTGQQHHKKSGQNDYAIDEELLTRAPIVLAMSNVIKKLPGWVFKDYFHGLIVTLNRLLLSRSTSVRQGARKIMTQFIQILGSSHLPLVIKELRQTFLKGFQLHVMIFTVHNLIAALESEMKAGDLDDCFEDIFEICKMELSSDFAEQKKNWSFNVVPEAKSNKSLETFIYLGKFISEKSMNIVIQMVKETIDARPKGGIIKRFGELLRAFSTGLHNNAGIDLTILIKFILSVLDQYLTEMLNQQNSVKSEKALEIEIRKKGYRPSHTLLLPPEPKRVGELVKHSIKSKVSIFVEFSLQLLADVLKAKPIVKQLDISEDCNGFESNLVLTNEKDRQFFELLNNFATPIIDCLKLKLMKIVSLALRCLLILLKYNLTNIKTNVQTIMDRLFVILSEYTGLGQTGIITELSQLLFKCFTQLLRDFPILTITPRRIEILLNYAEADLLDSHKQATSFSLIKAVIAKKIEDEKVENIVKYLSELSITSLTAHIRTQCRQVVLLYLMSHPSAVKSFEHWLEFFTNQTEYEFETGRLSALEMLHSIFEFCSEEKVNQLSLYIFMKLSSRLVNDESEECRKYVSFSLRKLFSLVNESSFNDLFFVAKDWLGSKKDSVQLLALKVFNDFCHVQNHKNMFNVSSKLYEIAEFLIQNLAQMGNDVFEKWSEAVIIATFEYLNSFIHHYPTKLAEIFSNIVDRIGFFYEALNDALRCISLPNLQLAASIFLHRLLVFPSQALQPAFAKSDNYFEMEATLGKHFPRGLMGVCFAMCAQLRHVDFRTKTLAEQATTNLSIAMSRIEGEEFDKICIKLSGICWREVSKESDSIMKRQSMFKIAAISVVRASDEKVESMCSKLLPLIYRELNRKSDKHTDELCQLANEVSPFFQTRLGEKKFSAHLLRCQKDASKRFEDRKKKIKALAVLDPAVEAIRKQKRHERKRMSKRRKLDEIRPYRVIKRRKREISSNV